VLVIKNRIPSGSPATVTLEISPECECSRDVSR
jgi:hypothetical protein